MHVCGQVRMCVCYKRHNIDVILLCEQVVNGRVMVMAGLWSWQGDGHDRVMVMAG